MTSARNIVSWIIWPVMMTGGLGWAYAAHRMAIHPPIILIVLQLVTVLCVAALERLLPEHEAWNVSHGDVKADILHGAVSGLLVSGALRFLIFAIVPAYSLWPVGWPLLAQLVLALSIADFGSYVTHVATHRVAWLWPIHAPHHSALRLYWLNASRMHPLDSASTLIISLLPLALLGAPVEVLTLFDAFAIVHLPLQHSNVRLRHGLLSHVIATAEFHRWHHSSSREYGEKNYASFLSIWDHLFGTYRTPSAPPGADAVGLYDGAPMPKDWLGQLRHPFTVW